MPESVIRKRSKAERTSQQLQGSQQQVAPTTKHAVLTSKISVPTKTGTAQVTPSFHMSATPRDASGILPLVSGSGRSMQILGFSATQRAGFMKLLMAFGICLFFSFLFLYSYNLRYIEVLAKEIGITFCHI